MQSLPLPDEICKGGDWRGKLEEKNTLKERKKWSNFLRLVAYFFYLGGGVWIDNQKNHSLKE